MKRFSVAFVAITGCIVGPACQAIVGIGDRIEASDGANTDDGSAPSTEAGGGGPTDAADVYVEPSKGCPAGCLPPAPTGWTGPSATYDGAESGKPADCPAEYANKELSVNSGAITAPPATCDCGEANILGAYCTASVVTWSQVGCPGLGAKQGSSTSMNCFAFPDMGLSYKVMPGVVTEGKCNYANAKYGTDVATFEKAQIACGQAQATACEGNAECIKTPAPAAPFSRLCIHRDGDQWTCPSADYSVKLIAYKDKADTRACTECTGTASGSSCGSNFLSRANTLQCNAIGGTTKSVSTCYDHPGMGAAIDIGPMGPTPGTCTLTGGKPTGEVKFTEPVTFCCNQ